ncbi:SA1362 family protein [Bacillus sp. P14.5]|uniref:SA1362 family protein n=1 Tax=Bacillus sp. P14.5 TaxID=1983400 RepID=UPI0013B06695|nr:SA1362 family protein [Bacillus sp. P14.5]
MSARTIIAGVIILFASIGLVSMLIGDPLALLQRIVIFAVIAGVIYFVFRKVMMGGGGHGKNKDQKAFLKAAKQSKKRYNHKKTTAAVKASAPNPFRKKSHRKKSQANLTVIEGKKIEKIEPLSKLDFFIWLDRIKY